MFSKEDIKQEKRFLFRLLLIGLVLIVINYYTGFFTRIHLANEETMALEHGDNSELFKKMVGELIDDLHSDISWEKQLAAVELGHLGKGASSAIPDLELLLQNENKSVRSAAVLAMARIGHYSASMVSPLIELLQNPNDHEKYLATRALGNIGPDARASIPLLQHELQFGHPEVKEVAGKALRKITSD